MFNTKDVQETAPKSKFLSPGINDDVHIHKIEGVTPEGKAPYLEFTMSTGDETASTKIKMYASTGAIPTTVKRLVHLAGVLDVRADLDNAYDANDDVPAYGVKLNKIFAGRVLRMKFSGEEYVNNNGQVRARIGFPVFEFAERMDVSPTKLRFDKTNQYDYKAIEQPDTVASGTDEGNELPF